MGKQKEVLKVLLKHYTKIGLNGGIAKVIFDDDFENIAEEIVKLFAIPVVVCSCCGKNTPEICGSCVSDIAQGTAEQAIDCR